MFILFCYHPLIYERLKMILQQIGGKIINFNNKRGNPTIADCSPVGTQKHGGQSAMKIGIFPHSEKI